MLKLVLSARDAVLSGTSLGGAQQARRQSSLLAAQVTASRLVCNHICNRICNRICNHICNHICNQAR